MSHNLNVSNKKFVKNHIYKLECFSSPTLVPLFVPTLTRSENQCMSCVPLCGTIFSGGSLPCCRSSPQKKGCLPKHNIPFLSLSQSNFTF